MLGDDGVRARGEEKSPARADIQRQDRLVVGFCLVPDGPVAVVAELGDDGHAVLVARDQSQRRALADEGEGHDHAVFVAEFDCVLTGLGREVEDIDLGWVSSSLPTRLRSSTVYSQLQMPGYSARL